MNDDCVLLMTCASHPIITDKFIAHASISCRQSTLNSEFSNKADSILAKYDFDTKNFNILHEDCDY